jgi:4-hydroxy-tetrahydrodipicolinate reductase
MTAADGGIRVGVIGAHGRMGTEACRAIESDDELVLVARLGRGDRLEALIDARTDVAVDLTTPDSVKGNVRFCVENAIDVVVGASGLTSADVSEIDRRAASSGARVLVVPNFAIGAVLMMRFAAEAAPYFDSAEIVERHHENKADAPSGTALRTAELMRDARAEPWQATPASRESLAGSRGGNADGTRLHSLRLPGSVAHQEVILGAPGQTLVIRHDSVDRSSFMPGLLRSVKSIKSLDGVVVGLEHVL